MTFHTQLRIPGPTPLPERVVRSMNRPMIDHRGPEFAAILAEITAGAKRVFKTKNDLLLLTSSGTGGLESAVANLVSPGDQVVAALCGNFGERFAALAAAYGADVVRLEFEWGQPVDPDDLAQVLQRHPKANVVLLTHNETSTGLTNPLRELARTARSAERLVVVDGVSSISSIDIETDAWGVDVAVSGSQKGWMAPPGFALVSVSERAWAQQAKARSPRFYFDWKEAKTWADKGMTPFTPAVPVAFAMQEGLRMLEEEGLNNVYERHERLARAAQVGLQALGFQLFAQEGYRSNTVTSAVPPPGLDVAALRNLLNTKYGVVIAGGQGKMTDNRLGAGRPGSDAVASTVAKILVADPLAEDGLERLRRAGEVTVVSKLGESELIRRIPEFDALVVRSETRVTAPVIEAGTKLRVVGRAGVGVDNIDVSAATRKGILVVNAPRGNIIAAAEHTIALLFSLARWVPQADASVKRGEWSRAKFIGTEIRGKTLGVIGLGNVGSEVAKRAHGLEMDVIAYDPVVAVERAELFNVALVSLHELLERADFVTLHVPLVDSNRNLLGAAELALMKPTARLVNT
ncbi:MAG: aminotransferase class V-fold PLP-dependent enzyme, partial [Chloroflexi bacterium]